MSFKKRKYGDYGGFELPELISGGTLKRLQAAIGTGLFAKTSQNIDEPSEPETSAEPPEETGGEEEISQD